MTIHVPFSKLTRSAANVRRVPTDLGPLIASVRADGLLQSLVVVPTDTGRYEVVAGERRRQAIAALVKDGAWPKDRLIACEPREAGDATALSLAENIERIAMHPADAYTAFADLQSQGQDETKIAHRFGYEPGEVRRLLRLGALSRKALKALAGDKIDVAFAQALALTDDHALQEIVLKRATSASEARRMITRDKVSTSSRMFRFVADSYNEAGGAITRDLFGRDGEGFADDAALVQGLADAKFERLGDEARAEGWAEVHTGEYEPNDSYRWYRVSPGGERDATDDEKSAVAAAEAAIAEREEAVGDNELSYDDQSFIAGQRQVIAEINRARRAYTAEQMQAGVLTIVIDPDGAVRRTAYSKKQASTRRAGSSSTPAERPLYSAAIVEDLSKLRTKALQVEIVRNADLALDVLLDALLPLATREHYAQPHAVQLRADSFRLDGADDINAETMPALADEIGDVLAAMPTDPKARFAWLRGTDTQTKQRLLAFVTATFINAVEGKFAERGRIDAANRIAADAMLDMTGFWKGSEAFYQRLTKRACLAALTEALGADEADKHAKVSKADLAKICAEKLAPTGWLPATLKARSEAAPEIEPVGGDDEAGNTVLMGDNDETPVLQAAE